MRRLRGEDALRAEIAGGGGVAPGKRARTESLQLRGDRAAAGRDLVGDGGGEAATTIAERGVAGASETLPYHDRVQAAFGHHDLGGLRASTGGAARDAAGALGAVGYAIGDRVGFAGMPDLFTVAHEATHHVQQRAGRVARDGRGDAEHERQADEVAARVVAGESAVDLLDRIAPAGGGGARGESVQLRKPPTSGRFHFDCGSPGGAKGRKSIMPKSAEGDEEKDKAETTDSGGRAPLRLIAGEATAYDAVLDALDAYHAAVTAAETATADGTQKELKAGDAAMPNEAVIHTLKAVIATADNLAALMPNERMLHANATAVRDDARAELFALLHGPIGPAFAAEQKASQPPGAHHAAVCKAIEKSTAAAGGDYYHALAYQQRVGFRGGHLATAADIKARGPAVLQSWIARGDMYHVVTVSRLFPQMNVVLFDPEPPAGAEDKGAEQSVDAQDALLARGKKWKQACEMAQYYGDPSRVFYTQAANATALAKEWSAYDLLPAMGYRGLGGTDGDDAPKERKADSGQPLISVGDCSTLIGAFLQRGLDRGIGSEKDAVAADAEALPLRETKDREAPDHRKRRALVAAAEGPAPTGDDRERATAEQIRTHLKDAGWQAGVKYVIVNFRASGHTEIERKLKTTALRADPPPLDERKLPEGPVGDAARALHASSLAVAELEGMAETPAAARARTIEEYQPKGACDGGNHPDLDTGVTGLAQLRDIVKAQGFVPVFMGEEPDEKEAGTPNLINYFRRPICKGGRAAEAFFLRVLAATYDVRALAMRSGVADQLALVGIPLISIDIDNFHRPSTLIPRPPKVSRTVAGFEKPDDQVANAWGRGGKSEAGLGRHYGRVFVGESKLREFDDRGRYAGGFSPADQKNIGDAIDFYWKQDTGAIRDKTHPFHPARLDETRKGGKDHEARLRHAVRGKIDTCLYPEVILAEVDALLTDKQVEQAQQYLDSYLDMTTPILNTPPDLPATAGNAEIKAAPKRAERTERPKAPAKIETTGTGTTSGTKRDRNDGRMDARRRPRPPSKPAVTTTAEPSGARKSAAQLRSESNAWINRPADLQRRAAERVQFLERVLELVTRHSAATLVERYGAMRKQALEQGVVPFDCETGAASHARIIVPGQLADLEDDGLIYDRSSEKDGLDKAEPDNSED